MIFVIFVRWIIQFPSNSISIPCDCLPFKFPFFFKSAFPISNSNLLKSHWLSFAKMKMLLMMSQRGNSLSNTSRRNSLSFQGLSFVKTPLPPSSYFTEKRAKRRELTFVVDFSWCTLPPIVFKNFSLIRVSERLEIALFSWSRIINATHAPWPTFVHHTLWKAFGNLKVNKPIANLISV